MKTKEKIKSIYYKGGKKWWKRSNTKLFLKAICIFIGKHSSGVTSTLLNCYSYSTWLYKVSVTKLCYKKLMNVIYAYINIDDIPVGYLGFVFFCYVQQLVIY